MSARVGGIAILSVIAILFTSLDAAFIFSGPFLPYVSSTLPVFLVAGAVLMAVMGTLSRFRCLYTGFQDEAVVIFAGIAAAMAQLSGGAVDDNLYVTMLVTVAAGTLCTAFFFILLGTLRLGRMIRYVPFSVTAGFMITIGGLLMSGGVELAESLDLSQVTTQALHGALPWKGLVAIVLAVVIVRGGRRAGALVALPIAFVIALGVFYLVTVLSGTSTVTLAEQRWLLEVPGTANKPSGWTLLLQAHIDWSLVAAQWRSFVSAAVISALALLLAVTALELSTRTRVDVDRELRAAGAANLGSALLGGAAGYHDDAVSAMLHKNLSGDRVTVLWAALISALAACLDPVWFSYVPLPLLGGVLIWLGWQLWRDWLFHNGKYLHRSDWIAVVAIAGVTLSMGFIAGVLLGIAVGIALFLVDYSQVQTVRYVVNGREIRSNVDRSLAAESLLYERGQRIHVVKLQGYLFFARSHQVLLQLEPVFDRLSRAETHFVVIDFQGVAGIDSTATMAFVRLKQMATDCGVELVFTGLGLEARVDLARIELADGSIHYFRLLDQGLAWCEDRLLTDGTIGHEQRVDASILFAEIVSLAEQASADAGYLNDVHVKAGETLIHAGEPADHIYLVLSGSLTVQIAGVADERIVLRGLEPGSVFGEMALYLGGTRTAAVVAEKDSVVKVLSNAALARMEDENPRIAMAIHKQMARLLATKLRQTNTWLSHLR